MVFYDALIDPVVLDLATQAECVDVGKRAGVTPTPQPVIEQLLIDAGARGLRVVRLKGGDPFVFGRGGEEALALQAAGVAFEIVPGVTSAVAAPALSGIPVTHRGTAAAFVVLTAADVATTDALIEDLTPGLVTLVAMMSVGSRAGLAAKLLDRGWPAATPSALLLGAATAQEWTWKGPLRDLASCQPPPASATAPGTIVVGAVAAIPLALINGAPVATVAAVK